MKCTKGAKIWPSGLIGGTFGADDLVARLVLLLIISLYEAEARRS